ncbi:MAG: hypothetical protein ACRDS0_26265 [Pseudonocardiaceae bacterium]
MGIRSSAAALDALRRVKPVDLLMHPYDAADRLRDVDARMLGVENSDLLTSRAASEIIWAMGRTLELRAVALDNLHDRELGRFSRADRG